MTIPMYNMPCYFEILRFDGVFLCVYFSQLGSSSIWQCGDHLSVTMGNCYRVPRRGGSRKDVSAAYRPTSAYNKSDASAFVGHSQVSSHNAYIGSVSRRAVSSSTSLQHISEREPDGESAQLSSVQYARRGPASHPGQLSLVLPQWLSANVQWVVTYELYGN